MEHNTKSCKGVWCSQKSLYSRSESFCLEESGECVCLDVRTERLFLDGRIDCLFLEVSGEGLFLEGRSESLFLEVSGRQVIALQTTV